jgi:hypothetical protein
MKIGDLVYDSEDDQYGIVTELNPTWTDHEGNSFRWDLKIFTNGTEYFFDKEEIVELQFTISQLKV